MSRAWWDHGLRGDPQDLFAADSVELDTVTVKGADGTLFEQPTEIIHFSRDRRSMYRI